MGALDTHGSHPFGGRLGGHPLGLFRINVVALCALLLQGFLRREFDQAQHPPGDAEQEDQPFAVKCGCCTMQYKLTQCAQGSGKHCHLIGLRYLG